MNPLPNFARWFAGLVFAGLAGGVLVATFPQNTAVSKDEAKSDSAKEGKEGKEGKTTLVSAEQAVIYKTLESFVTAFNANDAKALTANLVPDVEYIDEGSNHLVGAKQIEQVLTGYFKEHKGAQLQITPGGIRVVAPGVALEDAEAVITVPESGTQTARRISLLYVRGENQWKIASYREYPDTDDDAVDNELLKSLAFLIGDWVDDGPDTKVSTSFTMAKDGSHIQREFTVMQGGQETMKGNQRIAVDPLTGSIKGWTFDSANGHGESVWTPNGDSWLIRGTGVTQDGEIASATYILKPVGSDRIEIRTMHKVVGNQVEPDATCVLVRKLKKEAAATEKSAGN